MREKITESYLKTNKIDKPPIYLYPDIAFLLEPTSKKNIERILKKEHISLMKKPWVGFSVSELIKQTHTNNNANYLLTMAQTVDYIIKKYNASIIFVPHVVIDRLNSYDDRHVAKEIYELIKHKSAVNVINNEYDATELKGIISRCDLFIGARMHANIAALTSFVPTIGISWSHKTQGIMHSLSLDEYVCDFRTMTSKEIQDKINLLWHNQRKIKTVLKQKVPAMRNSTIESINLLKKHITQSV